MKKSLIALAIVSVLGGGAYAYKAYTGDCGCPLEQSAK